MRLGLAFRTFFAILFGRTLPEDLLFAVAPEQLPEPRQIEAPPEEEAPTERPHERAEPSPLPAPPPAKTMGPEAGAVQALAVLQSEGRLLDFLSEDIDGYADADVGAAVRDIHRGLRRALSDHFPVRPVRAEEEEALVTIPAGFDPAEVRLVGNVIGQPPFSGTLKHRGWLVEKVNLPRIPEGEAWKVVAAAEVEL